MPKACPVTYDVAETDWLCTERLQVIHSIPGQAADGTKAEAAAAAADMQVDGMQETVCNSAASSTVGHTAPVLCVAAHPRKPLLASAANDPDCTIKIWSAMSS